MPYYISNSAEGCSGWATVKEDGEVLGCHTTKQGAIDQALAIARAEGSEFVGERNLNGPKIKVSDIDGTLIGSAGRIEKTWLFLQSVEGRLILVTGRPESEREKTISELSQNDISYSRLIMNPGSTADSVEYKKVAMETLLERYNVIVAVENNTDVLSKYRELGVDAVAPRQIDNSGERRSLGASLKKGDYVSWLDGNDRIYGEVVQVVMSGSVAVPGSGVEILGTFLDPAVLIQVYEPMNGGWQDTEVFVGQKASILRKEGVLAEPMDEPEMDEEQIDDSMDSYDDSVDDSPDDLVDDSPDDSMDEMDDMEDMRQVDLSPPAYMRAAARQGLRYYEEGLGGDGLVERTIREARAMAEGNVTRDKWVRIRAWVARHLVDLDAPDAQPGSDGYPSAGVVAHLLWGSGPSKARARRVLDYAERIVARLEEENRALLSVETRDMAKIETRTNSTSFEVREAPNGNGMTFTGYAAVFNSPSEPLPFREKIAPGAFRRSLRARNDIKLFWNHDTGIVLGSTRAGTLRLEEDSIGLRVSADLPDTQAGRDAAYLIRRGDIDSMSFGFSVPPGGDEWSSDGTERTLKSVRLFEASIVSMPAYSATAGTTSVRNFDAIAKRADVDVDALADAMIKMESGENLTSDEANLITTVADRLSERIQDKVDQAQSDAEISPEMLELKKKKLEQLLKGI